MNLPKELPKGIVMRLDIIEVSEQHKLYGMGFGHRADVDTGRLCEHLFNGIAAGYRTKDKDMLVLLSMIISASESMKKEFPELGEKVRHTIIDYIKKGL